MKDETAIITENSNVKSNYYLMKIEAPHIASNAKPGNFVMLTVSTTVDPLLKRPFGIFAVQPPFIWLYYQVVGRGTEQIAGMKANDPAHVLGPLGNSFPSLKGKNILMVAGGRGIAPIHYAIQHYTNDNNVSLIYGAKTANDLNLLDKLEILPLKNTFLYTDDGSAGKKGFVTTDIIDIISNHSIDTTISCGPDAMFENLAKTIGNLETKLENYVSLESLMGCGFGVCYSCAVETASGDYKKVCSDGPVFRMEEIKW